MNYNRSEFQASYGLSSQLPESDRPEFVFSGRSNVGKSSLINRLCNRKNLARVSATPGKTATINFYRVDTSDKGLNALSSCIKQSTEALRGAVNEIRTLKNKNAIMEACIKVNTTYFVHIL